ncbi:MAG: isochorismatase family protein [Clostridiales bacterium]|nr:isochorismatase family protein [Clostridiales bacterium]
MKRQEMMKEQTIAIMIDMQEKLMPPMADRQQVTEKTKILLRGLNILGVPVLVSQQYTRGLGMTESELMEAGQLTDYFDKLTYSCYRDEKIRTYLDGMGESRQILLLGVEAHICVLQTALDLMEAGYSVFVAADCIASRNSYDKEIALRRMEQAGAVLTTAESCLFELLKQAGTDTFRQISRLVK